MFFDKKTLEENQKKLRKNATPEQLKMMDTAQQAVDQVGEEFFSAEAFEREDKLREQYRTLLKDRSINITDIESLLSEAKALRDKSGVGKTLFFTKFNKMIALTATDQIMLADDYVAMLEKTVIDITSNSQFTNLGFFDLIKLAFKKLIGRN